MASSAGDVTLTFNKPTWVNRIKTASIPIVQSTTPNNNATGVAIDITTIDLTFDQEITPVVGSRIYATAIGGNNETIAGGNPVTQNSTQVYTDVSNRKILHLKVDGTTVKPDVTYRVILPAGAVTSVADGTANEFYSYTFTMVTGEVAHSIGYPYTWDFQKMSSELISALSENAKQAKTNSTKQWMANLTTGSAQDQYDGTSAVKSYGNYTGNNSSGPLYQYQGKELQKVSNYEVKELYGLRMSLARAYGSGNNRIQVNVQNNNYSLTLAGNTQFITIPNVPQGKLYIRASVTNFMNINSLNATFAQNGTEITSNKSSVPTVYVLDVTKAGNLTLALGDVTFYQIAVAATSKTFKTSFKGYATDCQPYILRYDLTKTLGGTGVAAYIVKTVDADRTVATPTTVTCTPSTTGTILKATLSGVDMTLPLFVNDVNTSADNVDGNKLVGVTTATSIGSTASEGNYIFTNIYYRLDENDKSKVDLSTKSDVSMGFYNTVAGTIGANKSYLHLGIPAKAAKKAYILFDLSTETTGIDVFKATANNGTDSLPASYYTLEGIKVTHPQKGGIYIYKGKKVIIR